MLRAACPDDGTRMFRERDETNGGRSGRHSSVSTLAPNRSARGKKSRGAGFWIARSERKCLRRICSEAAKGCAPPPYRPAAARQPCVAEAWTKEGPAFRDARLASSAPPTFFPTRISGFLQGVGFSQSVAEPLNPS